MGIEGSNALPEDLVMFEILTRLPIKSLLCFKSVCKRWNSVISSDLDFAKLHLQNQLHNYPDENQYYHLLFEVRVHCPLWDRRVYSLNFQAAPHRALGLLKKFEGGQVNLVGSSNGLVCFHNKPDYELWNPATQAHHLIRLPPRIGWLLTQRKRVICQGFGYIPSFVDYKIVVVCGLKGEDPNLVFHVLVFSWMTNRWTEKEYDQHRYYELFHHNNHFNSLTGSSEPAVQLGETLHWCLNLCPDRRSIVLAFNLANESIDFVPLPSHKPLRNLPYNYVLSKISQHLCVSWYLRDAVEVWVLVQQHEEPKNSWKKFFTIVEDRDRRRRGRGRGLRHFGLLEVKDAHSDNSSAVLLLYHDCYRLVVMEQQIQAGVRPCIVASPIRPYQHRLQSLTPVEYVPSLMSPCPPPLS